MAPVTAAPDLPTVAVAVAVGVVADTVALICAVVLAAPPTTIRCDGFCWAGFGGAGSFACPAFSASRSSAWACLLVVVVVARVAAWATEGATRLVVATTETTNASVGRDFRIVLRFVGEGGLKRS